MTPQIESYIRASIGDAEFDVSKLVVFEARTLTTEPIHRAGGIHAGARVDRNTLVEMAASISAPGKSIPLQVMHQTGLLPVGRVFRGQVYNMDNGHTELRTMFYIPEDKAEYISDIESALIDEVSVGFLAQKGLCSDCGFDFFSEKASIMNIITATCDKEHTMGKNGAYLRLVGLRDFAEVSLVNRGAAKDAKILSRAKHSMSQDSLQKLAASGTPLEALLMEASYKLEATASEPNSKEIQMDIKELATQLQADATKIAQGAVELAATKDALTASAAEVTELKAKLETAEATIVELKKADNEGEKQGLIAKAADAEKKLSDAADKLFPHAKAALVASGVAEGEIPTCIVELCSMIEEKGLKLHQVVGSESQTDASKDDAKKLEAASERRKEAFKTHRKTY